MTTDRRHFVYRAFAADGALLYVGCTMDPKRRRYEHKLSSAWFPLMASVRLTGPLDEVTAKRLEKDAIRTEGPRYNSHVPERMRLERAHAAVADRRFHELLACGVDVEAAIVAAHEHADAVRPGPDHQGPFIAEEWA